MVKFPTGDSERRVDMCSDILTRVQLFPRDSAPSIKVYVIIIDKLSNHLLNATDWVNLFVMPSDSQPDNDRSFIIYYVLVASKEYLLLDTF